MCRAAKIRSSTLEENPLVANSPSLSPRPVKSKRNTPTPLAAKARLMWTAALAVLSQVKQCARSAKACASPSGRSSRADSVWPCAFLKSKGSDFIGASAASPLERRRRLAAGFFVFAQGAQVVADPENGDVEFAG